MKKIITTTLTAGLVATSTLAEVGVTMDFASAYVFRGVTLLDGASFQPGIEASGLGLPEAYGSVAVGIWGSADLEGDNEDTFQETDYYVSYSLPIETVDVSVGYTEYAYAAGSSDKEVSLGLGYDLSGVGISAAIYRGVGGGIGSTIYAELGIGYDIEVSEELGISLGARVGFVEPEEGDGGFNDYDLSIGASYALNDVWSLGLSGTYIGQGDDEILADVDDGGLYDVSFVGMLSLGASF